MNLAKHRRCLIWVVVACFALLAMLAPAVWAQEEAQEPSPILTITGIDTGSPPAVILTAFGLDSDGHPLSLNQESLAISHGGKPVTSVDAINPIQAGALTIFLIDNPPGVADRSEAIAEAITGFARAPTMLEPFDYIAVFQAGETNARQLLAPTNFNNEVRNFFSEELAPEAGATALVDSVMGLLAQVDELKPRPEMFVSLVVLSDGTDAVSTQFQLEDVPARAAELGIPIHTIWLQNDNLSTLSQELGQGYLATVSASSRGLAAALDDGAAVGAIWERLARFRDQTRIQYMVEDLSGGSADVRLSLVGQPEVADNRTIVIESNSPIVSLTVPPESRQISLPDLEAVQLGFSASVDWLDGQERQLEAAQLEINGEVVADISVRRLDNFEAEVENLVYGNNSVQVVVLDEQGLQGRSAPIFITVLEGAQEIPEALTPSGGFLRTIFNAFLFLIALALAAGIALFAWQRGWLNNVGLSLPRGRSRRTGLEQGMGTEPYPGGTNTVARLEVLDSVTQMPSEIALEGTQIRLGRSPAQSDIAFENDITVSRLHASLMQEGEHYRIFDEQSTSGTWVNDQQVPEYGTQLADGDEVHLGAVHLRYRQP